MYITFRNFVAIALALVFSAKASSAAPNILHLRMSTIPATLDWNGMVLPGEAPIIVNLCEGLFTYEAKGEKLVPGLAESLTRSKDLREYTFKIRPGAKWSDGKPITAQDFVQSWMRDLSPQSSSIFPFYFYDIVNARAYHTGKVSNFSDVGIKAINDQILVVKFLYPVKNWEVLTSFWPFFPVRKDMIEKFGNNWWRAGVMVTSGPFEIESSEPGIKMTLRRNPYYPKTNSNVDQVVVDFIENHEAALQKYEAKELLMLNGLPFNGLADLSRRSDFKFGAMYKEHMLSVNVDRFPMSNREFRLAVLQAIDPVALLPKGAVQLTTAPSLVPPPLPGSQKEPFIKFDPVQARAHLKKSGVVLDKKFRFQLLTSTEEPFSSSAIEIKNQLEKNLGFQVNLQMFPNQDLTAYKLAREFHLIDHSQNVKVWTSEDILKVYSTDSIENERHYSNPVYDHWLEIGKYKEAQQTLIGDEGVSLPLFYERNAYLMSPKLKGVYLNGMGMFILKNAVIE